MNLQTIVSILKINSDESQFASSSINTKNKLGKKSGCPEAPTHAPIHR